VSVPRQGLIPLLEFLVFPEVLLPPSQVFSLHHELEVPGDFPMSQQ